MSTVRRRGVERASTALLNVRISTEEQIGWTVGREKDVHIHTRTGGPDIACGPALGPGDSVERVELEQQPRAVHNGGSKRHRTFNGTRGMPDEQRS